MKCYRVFYIKNGMKLTKLVHAISSLEARKMFEDYVILSVVEIDQSVD
jgi:hypothetical protein